MAFVDGITKMYDTLQIIVRIQEVMATFRCLVLRLDPLYVSPILPLEELGIFSYRRPAANYAYAPI